MRISDWSSDVCSSDLTRDGPFRGCGHYRAERCRAADRLRVPAICAVQAHDGGREYWFRVVGAATARAAVASRDPRAGAGIARSRPRSEEHTSELQSLMRISYAAFCLKKKKYPPIYKLLSSK